jgi:uncharacterized membrane protein YhhN
MNSDAPTLSRLRVFGALDKWLLLTSILCSVTYLVTKILQPLTGSVVLKAMSIAPLAVLALRRFRDRDYLILGAALVFSCLGDIFLDLPGQHFIHGLSSFLVAHLLYILLFERNWPHPLRPGGAQMTLAAIVLVYSLLLSNWLSPDLGMLAAPVMIYTCAITIMAVSAIFAGFAKPWVWIGAFLFMISDSMIAAGKFKMPVPFSKYLIWATYYLGQCGIVIGFLQEKLGTSHKDERESLQAHGG